jgi:heme-degrading monooxygenase HmoA
VSHGAVLLMQVTVPPELEPEFNRWYDEEHIPELLRIPGMLSARRLRTPGEPRTYLALYEMTDAGVPDSEAFRRWRESSESTRRMAPRGTSVQRTVYECIAPRRG